MVWRAGSLLHFSFLAAAGFVALVERIESVVLCALLLFGRSRGSETPIGCLWAVWVASLGLWRVRKGGGKRGGPRVQRGGQMRRHGNGSVVRGGLEEAVSEYGEEGRVIESNEFQMKLLIGFGWVWGMLV
ncbi:UNVERIFIED_CONTAM: hypothetical protein Sradi_0041000 [Sesamum radiatum]|uniref:Uncharacterized protein n=1 Tax=Sesamum radiatum TaxID=300843 RepID=A0AAW2WIE2_SESRA